MSLFVSNTLHDGMHAKKVQHNGRLVKFLSFSCLSIVKKEADTFANARKMFLKIKYRHKICLNCGLLFQITKEIKSSTADI